MNKIDSGNHNIIQRNIHFDVDKYTHPAWFNGDPVLTAFCDSLSLTLPDGERFFIKAIRHYAPQVRDEALQRDISDFIMQEAFHTREHEAYNNGLRKQGLDVDRMEGRAKALLDAEKSRFRSLLITIALEHITATFAHTVLNDDTIFEKTPLAYRDMWTWHALEEMEHNAVAFAVFEDVFPDLAAWKKHAVRCITLLKATYKIHRVILANMRDILLARGHKITLSLWLHGAYLMFVWPGFYRRSMGYYLSFFRPGFHPAHTQRNSLVDKWTGYFAEQMKNKETKHA